MSDLTKARELEDLQVMQLIDQLNEEEDRQITEIKARNAASGTLL